MFSSSAIESIKAIKIETIAAQLEITAKNHMCCCPFHDDKHPSMKMWNEVNGWKCYACGEKGTSVDLVMKKLDLSYIEALRWIAKENGIYEEMRKDKNEKTKTEEKKETMTISEEKVRRSLSINNMFCQALVDKSILTASQMRHASEVYRLGSTHDGGVIFWQIDEKMQVREGKVMWYEADCHRSKTRNPVTISYLMKQRRELPQEWRATPCLFGLHLTNSEGTTDSQSIVAIVESEKTAIICSELFSSIPFGEDGERGYWLASGGLNSLTAEMLLPLKGHRIILFPDTDTKGEAYSKWLAIAEEAKALLGHPVYVSDVLEKNATKEQKERKIDIADLIISST